MSTDTKPAPSTLGVLHEVAQERVRQDDKWGPQDHPLGTGADVWAPGQSVRMSDAANAARSRCQANGPGQDNWFDILYEEVMEAGAEVDPGKVRVELIQVAAVAVNAVECIDRNYPRPEPAGETPEELPYGSTVRDLRLMIARHAQAAENDFRDHLDRIAAQPAGPVSTADHVLSATAHHAALYGWSVASLLGWLGETYGPAAAYEAAAMVQDMGENGGADWCEDLMADLEKV